MQERSRKLRLALLVPMFGLATGLAAAQGAGVTTNTATGANATTTSPGATTHRAGVATTLSLATPPGPVGASGITAARANGGLDCPTLAGVAALAGCDGQQP